MRGNVPYLWHEGEMARAERNIRRLWLIALAELAALIATNIAWFIDFLGLINYT